MADNKNDRPDTPNRATVAMAADLSLVRDVSKGTSAVREKGRQYLPQAPAERSDDYLIRLARAVFFNAFIRTVSGLVGMVFRRDPVLGEDVPPVLIDHAESIDDAGTHMAVFIKTVFADCIEAGHAGILVDAPVTDGESLSMAEERDRGIRPFWVHIKKDDIVSWRTIVVNGVERLSQLVLKEIAIKPEGEFGEERVERYRVLQREEGKVTFEIWETPEDKNEPEKTGEVGIIQNVTEIPFAIAYSRKVGFLTSIPPLIDLAYTNIAHYQVLADHLHALHVGSVPIFFATGVAKETDLQLGPNTSVMLPDVQSKVGYVEHSGAALGQTRQQLIDFKTDMAVLGLGMLQHETRAAETAEAKRMDKSEQDSVLATAARSMQDAVEVAMGFHAQMLKLPTGGSIALNQDFEKLSLDATQIQAYSALVLAGQISLETFWVIMQEGGALHDGFDPEMELTQIEDLMPPEPEPVVVVGEDEDDA